MMKNKKDIIRCLKFFGKFAWQTNKTYFLLLAISITVNSVSPFISFIGSQYLIDEIAEPMKRNISLVVFWVVFICGGIFISQIINKITSEYIGNTCARYDRILKTNLCMSCIDMKFKNTEDTDVLDMIKNAERALNETDR